MADIIIPLGNGSHSGNEELKMLLRSIEAHVKGYGRVFLVTAYCPEWINRDTVTVVHIGDPYTNNKDANLHMKTLQTISQHGITGNFIWCADDNCFLQDIDSESLPILHNHRPNSIFYETAGTWRLRVRNTLEWAKKQGVNLPWNYECHAPQLFNAHDLELEMKDVDYVSLPGLTIYTTWRTVTNTWEHTLNQNDYKHTFEMEMDETVTHMTDAEFHSKPFLGFNDACSMRVLRRLRMEFPNKSKFEI